MGGWISSVFSTFDGESETVYVEAYNEAEASDKAAAQVGNADYTMVYAY